MSPSELRTIILAQPAGGPIRTAYDIGDVATCARLLRETSADQQALPPLVSAFQLKPHVSDAHFAAVFDHPRFTDFKATFDAGDRPGVLRWVEAFAVRGLISVAEVAAITGALTTPTTQNLPLVPGCTHEMVSAAREAN